MPLNQGFPGHNAAAAFADIRRDLEGSVVRDAAGKMRSGVFPAHFNALVTGRSDMKVAIADFRAVIDRGGAIFMANVGADTSVTLDAAPAANRRIDLIYAIQQSTTLGDAASLPIFGFVKGTASATPVAPSLPANLSTALPLATVEIPAGATTTLSAGVVITQVHPYTAMAGGTVATRSTVELAAWTPADGSRALLVADGTAFVRVSGAWRPAGRVWSVTKNSLVSVSAGAESIAQTLSTGISIPAGTRLRLSALGVGLYVNGGASAELRWRYTTDGSLPVLGTTPSPEIPTSSLRRTAGLSGSVTTHDFEAEFVMPTTGILQVALTFKPIAAGGVFTDPWALSIET